MSDESVPNLPASERCLSCGKKNDADANFCEHCGAALAGGQELDKSQPAEVPDSLFPDIKFREIALSALGIAILIAYRLAKDTKAEIWFMFIPLLMFCAIYIGMHIYKDKSHFISRNWTELKILIIMASMVNIMLVILCYRQISVRTAAESNVQWHEFIPPGGRVSISFPTEPVHQTERQVIPGHIQVLKLDTFTSRLSSRISYVLAISERLSETREFSSREMLQNWIERIRNSGSTVLWYKFEGTEPRLWADVKFRRKSGEKSTGRMAVTDTNLYFLWVEHKTDELDESKYTPFINSFHIK